MIGKILGYLIIFWSTCGIGYSFYLLYILWLVELPLADNNSRNILTCLFITALIITFIIFLIILITISKEGLIK